MNNEVENWRAAGKPELEDDIIEVEIINKTRDLNVAGPSTILNIPRGEKPEGDRKRKMTKR